MSSVGKTRCTSVPLLLDLRITHECWGSSEIHWVKHTAYPFGRGEGGTRSGRTRKKPKDLRACDSDERGRMAGPR